MVSAALDTVKSVAEAEGVELGVLAIAAQCSEQIWLLR